MMKRMISLLLCLAMVLTMAPALCLTVPVKATTAMYYPACDSSYTSLYPALASIGVECDWELQCRIAEKNGITDFTGTVAQNTQLLDLLKEGKLLNPDYTAVSYYPACDSSYTSLYPALASIGVECDWELQCRIADANGITDFTGTVAQNTQLLDLLKAGKLINPDGAADSGSSGGTGVFENGYDKGYAGGMPGDGKIYAHGLDVSSWQGTSLNFQSIKDAGYDFVILRAGTTMGKDTCFDSYYTKARAAGLDIGTYYYTYATTVAGAQTDASNMLSWIAGKTFEYPVYFDYEDVSQDSLSTTTAKNICLTFCDAMAEAGYLAGVYTGYYKSTQLPMDAICAKYEVWIANYWDYTYETLSPSYSTKYGMYQYTDRNYIGSNGPYDGNVAFKDYPSIVQQYGFNGYAQPVDYLEQCTRYPTHCLVTTSQSTPLNTLPCSASSYGSDTVLTAESGVTYTANALYRNADGDYWYQITLDTGETAYLYGGHSSFVRVLTEDITLTGGSLPGDMEAGTDFALTGSLGSAYNQLLSARVTVTSGETVINSGSAEITDNAYVLDGSTLAASAGFATLTAGAYRYELSADYTGYYAVSDKELAAYTGTVVLAQQSFSVTQCNHSFTSSVAVPPTCTEPGVMERTCSLCGQVNQSTILATGHSYTTVTVEPTCTTAGKCTQTCSQCGDTVEESFEPTGHSYTAAVVAPGCESSGYTVHTCSLCGHSYNDSLTPATGHSYTAASLEATCTQSGGTCYTCGLCGDSFTEVTADPLGHSYENGVCTACGAEDPAAKPPVTLTAKYPSLSFEDEVFINIYFAAENLGSLDTDDMGLILWNTARSDGTVENADLNLPGAVFNTDRGLYCVRTKGIAPQKLGDTFYFKVYLRLEDGSYLYTKLLDYSPKTYAVNALTNSASVEQKAMVVAMLNWGAAAQTYFNYKPYNLMNTVLTEQQQALVEDYRADMMNPAAEPESSKVGIFTNTGGFSKKYPSITFEGAFSINYYFTPSLTPSGPVKLYYWNEADYLAAATLKPANATGWMYMTNDGTGVYHACVKNIAAKDLDGTIYVAAGYTEGDVSYCTGVLAYSIGAYCTSRAAAGTAASPLAKATAVYGYYAKSLFYF